jgi:hypothetical protein
MAVFDGAEAGRAGTYKGTLNAIPSVSTVAIDARFLKVNMLNSIYRASDIGLHSIDTIKLQFRNGRVGLALRKKRH